MLQKIAESFISDVVQNPHQTHIKSSEDENKNVLKILYQTGWITDKDIRYAVEQGIVEQGTRIYNQCVKEPEKLCDLGNPGRKSLGYVISNGIVDFDKNSEFGKEMNQPTFYYYVRNYGNYLDEMSNSIVNLISSV